MEKIKTQLIDDGTLDTVIAVNGREYRYNFQNGDFENYDDFLDWCEADAIEQYQMEGSNNDI